MRSFLHHSVRFKEILQYICIILPDDFYCFFAITFTITFKIMFCVSQRKPAEWQTRNCVISSSKKTYTKVLKGSVPGHNTSLL